jgi:ribosome-associated protein
MKKVSKLSVLILKTIHDKNADEVIVYDLKDQALVDSLILVLTNNTRKLNAIKDELRRLFLNHYPDALHHIEGQSDSGWVVVDTFESAIHILTFEVEEKYKLKELFASNSKNS